MYRQGAESNLKLYLQGVEQSLINTKEMKLYRLRVPKNLVYRKNVEPLLVNSTEAKDCVPILKIERSWLVQTTEIERAERKEMDDDRIT